MPRKVKTLTYGWEFALERCEPHEAWENAGSAGLSEPEGLEYRPVVLPHDWAATAPFDTEMEQGAAQGYRNRWGIGWYRTRLTVTEVRAGYVYRLEFGGIYENSTVWVNGCVVGGRKYGYSPFRVDITGQLKSGQNDVLVRVDNSTTPVDRWYSGCGIYRSVRLVEVPERHLEPWEVVVQSSVSDGEAVVAVDTGQRATVKGVLREKGGRKFTACAEDGRLTFRVPDAQLWSAEEPNLYELTLWLMDGEETADELTQKLGIRTVAFLPERGMLVNGKEEKLKGVCLHQDISCVGTAATRELWRERLQSLKELGCNAIRAAHHVFAEDFLDLCDELGFYVYEECFDKWKGGLYGRYFETESRSDLETMVRRDRNRACIVIWGVGNEVENQAQASMLRILAQLKEQVVSLDASRPVSYAMNPHFKRESGIDAAKVKDIQQFVDEVSDTEIDDPLERVAQIEKIAAITDIISCNYQEQWYDLIHERIPGKLILGTEVYEYFQGAYEQMQNFSGKIPSLVPLEKDFCIGSFIWTGYDYLGESMGYPAKGWSGALVHTNGEKRPIYYMLKSIWTKEPMIHFSVMDYSMADEGVKEHWDCPPYADHWHFPQFRKTVIPYMIATNCEEAALFLNGKRFWLPRPSECLNGVITGFLPWQPGCVEAVGYRDGKEACRYTVRTPGMPERLVFDTQKLVTQEAHLRGGVPFRQLLTVRAVDGEGIPCIRAEAKVCFRAEGDVRLIGVDNGNICSDEPYGAECIRLYHGCASVMLELSADADRGFVYAQGDGLEGAVCEIDLHAAGK